MWLSRLDPERLTTSTQLFWNTPPRSPKPLYKNLGYHGTTKEKRSNIDILVKSPAEPSLLAIPPRCEICERSCFGQSTSNRAEEPPSWPLPEFLTHNTMIKLNGFSLATKFGDRLLCSNWKLEKNISSFMKVTHKNWLLGQHWGSLPWNEKWACPF